MELTSTEETFLRILSAAERAPQAEPVLSRLAEEMHIPMPSAARTAQSLAMKGLIRLHRFSVLSLTAEGKRQAAFLAEREETAYRFLGALLGSDGSADVRRESDRVAHVISERTVRAMQTWLSQPAPPHSPLLPDPAEPETGESAAENA